MSRRAQFPVNTGKNSNIEASGAAVAGSHSDWDEQSVVCSESLSMIFGRANRVRVHFIAVDMQEFGLEEFRASTEHAVRCKLYAGVLRGTTIEMKIYAAAAGLHHQVQDVSCFGSALA